MNPSKSKRILIVGGGVAGLATAHHLLHDSRWKKHSIHITLSERKGRYGGRVKTVSLENKADGWYEAGASRIGDTHRRVRALGEAVGCKEVALRASYDQRSVMPSLYKNFQHIHTRFVKAHGERALKSVTWWDVLTMMCGESERDRLVQRWGFLSVVTQMNAHDFWHYAMPQYLCKMYYTFEGGLQQMVNGLVHTLEKSGKGTGKRVERVELKPSTKVVSVVWLGGASGFEVTLQDDSNASLYHANHERTTTQSFDMVFLALPSEALYTMKGMPEMYAHFWTSVSRNRLIRCYAKYPPSKYTRKRGVTARNDAQLCRSRVKSSILNKCTTTHAPQWRQISYCDHTHADHIYNVLRMPDGLPYFKEVVAKTLGKPWVDFADDGFDVHYWKAGTHSWKPELTSDAHYDRALQPDAKIPMFVVGSSLSHYQHWMEGALETVEDACKKCWRYAVEWWDYGTRKKAPRAVAAPDAVSVHTPPFYLHNACEHAHCKHTMGDVQRQEWVVLDGYVYDVKPFMHRHPGGRNILTRMLGKDISVVYHRIGHSSTARAWAEEHCRGVLEAN